MSLLELNGSNKSHLLSTCDYVTSMMLNAGAAVAIGPGPQAGLEVPQHGGQSRGLEPANRPESPLSGGTGY